MVEMVPTIYGFLFRLTALLCFWFLSSDVGAGGKGLFSLFLDCTMDLINNGSFFNVFTAISQINEQPTLSVTYYSVCFCQL